jgi:hypothetical protein
LFIFTFQDVFKGAELYLFNLFDMLSRIRLEMMPTLFEFKNGKKSLLWSFVLILLLSFLFIKRATAQDSLTWDRFRINAELSVSELYSDNIYLTHQGEKDDFFTRFNPELEFETALTKGSRIGLSYRGIFEYYNEADNFRSDHHFGGINFGIESSKESSFQLGINFENGATRPNSIEDESADFRLTEIYSDLEWRMTPITFLGAGYQHSVRSFDENRYQGDDFVRDNVRLDLLYTRSQKLPLLLEYRLERQRNDNMRPESGELISHAVLAGCRWRPEQRLSGTFELGYFRSRFNQIDTVDGWMIDADLLYRISEFTGIEISADRVVRVSEFSARDTLDYYISSGFGVTLTNRRFDPLELSVEGAYENRAYRLSTSGTTDREDDLYRISIQSDYQLKRWLALSFDYSYRTNQSSMIIQEYKENLFQFEVIFSI